MGTDSSKHVTRDISNGCKIIMYKYCAGQLVKHKLAPITMIVIEEIYNGNKFVCRYFDTTEKRFVEASFFEFELEKIEDIYYSNSKTISKDYNI